MVGCLVCLKDKSEVFVAEAPLSPFFPPFFVGCLRDEVCKDA